MVIECMQNWQELSTWLSAHSNWYSSWTSPLDNKCISNHTYLVSFKIWLHYLAKYVILLSEPFTKFANISSMWQFLILKGNSAFGHWLKTSSESALLAIHSTSSHTCSSINMFHTNKIVTEFVDHHIILLPTSRLSLFITSFPSQTARPAPYALIWTACPPRTQTRTSGRWRCWWTGLWSNAPFSARTGEPR